MGPQSLHALKRIIERSKCRASIVSRYHAYVVFQVWEEFFQTSHRTFIHINVEITDMKQGEAIENGRHPLAANMIVPHLDTFGIPLTSPKNTT